MKKIISTILILASIAMLLTACGPKETGDTDLPTTPSEVQPADDTDEESEEVDVIEEDLTGDDLENLDEDLAEIDW